MLHAVGVGGGEGAEVLQVDEFGVSVIWGEVIVSKKVGAKYSGLDVRDYEVVLEVRVADGDGAFCCSET